MRATNIKSEVRYQRKEKEISKKWNAKKPNLQKAHKNCAAKRISFWFNCNQQQHTHSCVQKMEFIFWNFLS